MKKKSVFYTELAYLFGLALLAFGTALMTYGGFGLSTAVAPAYLLHLYISSFFPGFSFGIAQYVIQGAVLLLLAILLRKPRLTYLLTFCTAAVYALLLDSAIRLISLLPEFLPLRIAAYILGAVVCCNALAFIFESYLPPAAYDLFSKEMAAKFQKPVYKFVNLYNLGSLLLAVVFSFLFFGDLRGLGIGTVVCALSYGSFIRFFQRFYHKHFHLTDKLSWRRYFEA